MALRRAVLLVLVAAMMCSFARAAGFGGFLKRFGNHTEAVGSNGNTIFVTDTVSRAIIRVYQRDARTYNLVQQLPPAPAGTKYYDASVSYGLAVVLANHNSSASYVTFSRGVNGRWRRAADVPAGGLVLDDYTVQGNKLAALDQNGVKMWHFDAHTQRWSAPIFTHRSNSVHDLWFSGPLLIVLDGSKYLAWTLGKGSSIEQPQPTFLRVAFPSSFLRSTNRAVRRMVTYAWNVRVAIGSATKDPFSSSGNEQAIDVYELHGSTWKRVAPTIALDRQYANTAINYDDLLVSYGDFDTSEGAGEGGAVVYFPVRRLYRFAANIHNGGHYKLLNERQQTHVISQFFDNGVYVESLGDGVSPIVHTSATYIY